MSTERRLDEGLERRRRTMEVLARADEKELAAAWSALGNPPDFTAVRGPETGLVMVRGRIGGGGSPFNLGETSVSRATIRLETGEIGHGHVLGLSRKSAELIALFDALAQRPELAGAVDDLVLRVSDRLADEDAREKRRTAATKVEFFTMVRGDD
ncbi:phosphonate C-P lyase system protein PhnG [Rhizobium sp. KVB221]|uniref:Phosphonate C-P lyase system protein PhnG n=1 Tax=Rhizobium setariae TaxID=2801340 RepID=A0A936YUL0_9HYPH|nr:phosphonate C-P lyase system protein PhnG [Rhizobium setariae]MBL0372915.1 phosphonate C-P lyase system protein PhnG [Rhizobium setariae]